jgi:hypothetical protein
MRWHSVVPVSAGFARIGRAYRTSGAAESFRAAGHRFSHRISVEIAAFQVFLSAACLRAGW